MISWHRSLNAATIRPMIPDVLLIVLVFGIAFFLMFAGACRRQLSAGLLVWRASWTHRSAVLIHTDAWPVSVWRDVAKGVCRAVTG